MKYTVRELQQLLADLETMEQADDMDTLDQWEDYKDDNWRMALFRWTHLNWRTLHHLLLRRSAQRVRQLRCVHRKSAMRQR